MSTNIAQLQRIDQKKQRLDDLRPFTTGELMRLQEEFMVEFTYNTNAIEGNTLTLQETAMVLEGLTIDQKPLKEHLEAIGHRDAFGYILRLVKDQIFLDERVIKDIHSLVLMDRPQDKGVYRSIPVRIMGSDHEPPHPLLVPEQMQELLINYEEMKKNMHPIECISVFHLLFEGIHPFVDGNGRTGRLLLNLELLQAGFPAVNIKFTERKRYYACFHEHCDTGCPHQMVSLIAQYVEEVLDRYLRMLEH